MTLQERFHVDGEPRDAELTDFDGDGWNDAVIIIRDADKVQAYRNVEGRLVLSSEAPVGKSPREIALADFNDDLCEDFVVVNRHSYDVSILLGCGADAVGFQKLDQTYPVDGEVAGLLLADLNGDARADVLQLHRASSEISVRLSGEEGQLSTPVLHSTGLQPNGFDVTDINGDQKLDVITANLGLGPEPGSLSVLLGNGSGGFNPAVTLPMPEIPGQPMARLLTLKAADFDQDYLADLVVGFADSRIAFFRGLGNEQFEPAADYSAGYPTFVFETRQFAAGDFDQDGDLDLAGVGFFGELGVLNNDGQLMSQIQINPRFYGAPELDNHMWYRARELRLEDLNDDQDPDLVIGLDAGLAIFYGSEGVSFQPGQFQSGPGVPVQRTLPEIEFSVSGFAFGDFDTDGDRDLAVACFADGCLTILSREPDAATFQEAIKVKVPSAEFVVAGDIDGDGLDDLAGTGRTALWVALSGHEPRIRPSEALQFDRETLPHPVLNEIMSANQGTLLGSAGDRYPDWVELYNPLDQAVDLTGWTLELLKENDEMESFAFPAGLFLAPKDRKLILCANNPGPDLINTGFRLPDEGGTLFLKAPGGSITDQVAYPSQKGDIAYARFSDGVAAFTSTGMATPGSPNVYTGAIPPGLKFRGFDTENFQADMPVRLYAEADDDAAVLGVSLSWRRVDILNDSWHRVLFYDDGRHEDEGTADGLYSGVLQPGLPDGAAIQFYLEANDVNGKTTYLPESPDAAEDFGSSDLFVLAFGQGQAPIEITEVVSENGTVWYDELGGTPDYVEIGNVSGEPVLMDEYGLIDRSLEADKRFLFPAGTLLQPGQTVLVVCDSNPFQGLFHADFRIDNDGDKIYLQQRTVSGAFVTIDAVDVPALEIDRAYARVGARGPWLILPATPNAPNLSDNQLRFRMRTTAMGMELILTIPVAAGVAYVIEGSAFATGPWTTLATGIGTQVAANFNYFIQAEESRRFFRVRSE